MNTSELLRNEILKRIREKKKTFSDISDYSGIDKKMIRDAFENPDENVKVLLNIANAMKINI